MAGTFISTQTYSNLTRLELEQLRRGDFTSGGKALTVGDSALAPEGVVGKGDVNAEPFYTGPSVNLDDVYPITPLPQPGPGLLSSTMTGGLVSDYARWYGPTLIFDSLESGFATAAASWQDNTLVTDFVTLGVLPGDLLLIKEVPGFVLDQNQNTVATISVVAPNTLTVSNIWNPNLGIPALVFGASSQFSYLIVRPLATQLFAVPGSGPVGEEQTFLMVTPGSALHATLSPTTDQINLDRIRDVIRPNAGLDASVDRADYIYSFPATRQTLSASLLTLGYRVVLYPDDGTGLGPDLNNPITTLNPTIDPGFPAADQRMTFDYKAGTVRFSCAPKIGGQIKVVGGVEATTGRLNLYAVFWAIDLTLTAGNARGLYQPRSTSYQAAPAARVHFDPSMISGGWRIGSTISGSDGYVKAIDTPEGYAASATSRPFVELYRRRSTEIGTFEVTVGTPGPRYFSYRQGENKWRFAGAWSDFEAAFGSTDAEMFVADKTEFTVSDAGGPANYAANLNPDTNYGGSVYGIRSHANLRDLYRLLAATPHGTVHLKKGRYYLQNELVIPPGTTVEGEGPGTRVIFRNFDSDGTTATARGKAVFKVGPNTTWGVYDASAIPDDSYTYKTYIEPTVFPLTGTIRVEGMDTVWNPVRRCWGVVYGEATSNSIYFNEVLEDGSTRFPGLGINVKDNVFPLFVSNTTPYDHQNHSGSHYPRIAYQEHANEYAVVWVEEISPGGLTGGQIAMRWFSLNATSNPLVPSGYEVLYNSTTQYPIPPFPYADHPSIAVENFTTNSSTYTTCVTFWSYDRDIPGFPTSSIMARQYFQGGTVVLAATSAVGLTGHEVVSSTDVAADAEGGFMAVWTIRGHSLWRGLNATLTNTPPDTSLTDPAVLDWNALGIVPGSKVHILVSPTFPTVQQGLSGVVTLAAGGDPNLHIKYEGGSPFFAEGPGVGYAITPISKIRGLRTHLIAGLPVESLLGDVAVVEPREFLGNYHIEMRESDYARISRGAASWCVVFQGFNSHCGFAYPVAQNYDHGQIATGPTFGGILMGDPEVYREHISTCSVILRDDGRLIYPTTSTQLPGPLSTGPVLSIGQPQLNGRVARDLEVSLKSLGTRAPITHRPNYMSLFSGLRIPVNEVREISPHNFSYRWTTTGMQACIPDVSWTGQDWVAVSPAKQCIHSFTGMYQPNGGNCWLSDALFYFGQEGPGTANFGWHLKRTFPSGAEIFFPSLGLSFPILDAADEHTASLPGNPLGGVPLANVEWVLMYSTPDAAGVKNQGFRIGADGRLIASTDFITWADQPSDTSTDPREVELMRRPQTRGGNYPSQVAGELAGESADALEPGSRYKANIGFRGVAPGRPKGMSRRALLESPMAALAWGENLYGFVDRLSEGTGGGTTGQVEFFRQSFGPYNVTLRNFTIESTPGQALAIRSYSHVYTRHLAPVASAVSFDTDGIRNVFVYPTTRIFSLYYLLPANLVTSYIGTVYTNALGQDPLYMDGPTLGRGDLSAWSSDISWEELYPTWIPSATSIIRYAAPGIGPKVIWDGQRFAIFWIERANRTFVLPAISNAAVGYFLCMSYLPGSEDGNLQTSEMVDPYEIFGPGGTVGQFPLASVHISDGSGSKGPAIPGSTLTRNTLAVCDVAFSGKVYAVVWSAGLSPDYLDPFATAGSTLGVTLFNMDSATAAIVNGGTGVNFSGGGTTYVIEQDNDSGSFQNPKIVWDGSRFMVFYEVVQPTSTASTAPPNLNAAVCYAVVPEDGLARPVQTKQISGRFLVTGTDYPTADPGSLGPFTTLPLGAFSPHALGCPVWVGAYAAGSPFWAARYTVIQMFGTQLSPFITTSVAGATLGTTLTDATKNFFNLGVRAGDYLFISTFPDTGGYVVEYVSSATTLEIIPYGAFVGGAALTYVITRYQQPLIQPGDMLVVSAVNFGGVYSSTSNGVYPVINYNPKTHQLTVQGEFAAGDHDTLMNHQIRGEIRSGGISDYDNGGTLESTRAGINPRSALIANPNWATGATTTNVNRLHGVAYNDVDDEFAVLVTHADNTSVVYGFKPNVRTATPEVWLNYAGTSIPYGAGDIAWNGSHFLVVVPSLRLSDGVASVQAKLLNSRFSEEVTLPLIANYSRNDLVASYAFGNLPGKIPGPGYGDVAQVPPYTGKIAGTVWPWISGVKVKWNPRLSRWLVSVSVGWYDQATSSGNTYDNGGTEGLFVPSGGALITAWVGNVITFSGLSQAFQPGMKLVIALPLTIVAAVTIIELLSPGAPGTGYGQVRVDATNADCPSVVPGVSIGVTAFREDVFLWTLGQDATGLRIEDADNVSIEDVVVGGGATDIEEKWTNMGRPIWQAAGQTFGSPRDTTFAGPLAQASLTRQPQYNHRFMTPAGKVNLPKYSNVTSAGHHPYGRTAPPGASYMRDRLRNRRGG